MEDDATAMIALPPRDSLGYSLRATARHQLGQYERAITDYDSAISFTERGDPRYIDLNARRCDVLMAMGQYDRVIADARQCLEAVQDTIPLEFRVFCALIALGDYEAAGSLFRRVTESNSAARGKLRNWSMKYVFDTLDVGRSWHRPDIVPEGVAFLAMLEADETYHHLSAKARRVVTDAFTAHWSPDGTKLAFSTGFWGYSGVAVWDAETRQTDLLIVPGKDPRWSPDGRYLVFVRDCLALPLSEFVGAERVNRHRGVQDQEVWIMKSDSAEPRRLVSGSWPRWSRDPNHIYFYSQRDGALCEISIEDADARPQTLLKCADLWSEISPDGKYVACEEGTSLKVLELASASLRAEWTFPSQSRGKTWSSDGRELCFNAFGFGGIPSGLWVYDLDKKQTRKVLEGPIWPSSLAPDGTQLVFNLEAPYFEIWVADLDPNTSIVDSLGPGLTLDELYQEKLAFYTQRIEANPEDANNYRLRAQYHGHLGDRASANADMRWWAILAPRDRRRVINLPFDCQLVFSAERPVNMISMVSVAFGQKGRCKMKLFEIPMCVTSVFGICLLFGLDAPPVYANFVFGEPVNLGPTVNTSYGEYSQSISADGLTLYSGEHPTTPHPKGYGGGDIWVTTRETTSDPWAEPVSLGPTVNTSSGESGPCISADGLSLYFNSNRAGGCGGWDLWVTTRETTSDPWAEPVNLGSTVNSWADDVCPSISADGLELYFCDYWPARPGGYGITDLWVTKRPTKDDPWGTPVNLGDTVNGRWADWGPFISADSLMLLFGSDRPREVTTTDDLYY